jgi:hypothetical protein
MPPLKQAGNGNQELAHIESEKKKKELLFFFISCS